MIDELEVRGFRSFSELHMRGLTRVNVIVGKNNAGKTSLLDALEVLFLRPNPMDLFRSLWRRKEVPSRGPDQGSSNVLVQLDARQLFHGRSLDHNASFGVAGKSGEASLRLDVIARQVKPRVEQVSPGIHETVRFVLYGDTEAASFQWPLSGTSVVINTTQRSALEELSRPHVYVGTGLMSARDRGRLWDSMVGNDEEDFVTQAVKTAEPNVERILFTSGEAYGGTPTSFVRLKGVPERVPLGNLGHGATRLLEIAMLLVQARDGAFLMDEIEIGLHYSVMASVWRLILATAQRLNIQVFATTHSQDCLEALAGLYEDDRSLANVVSLHRLDVGATKTERFSMEDIQIAETSKLELRGLP